jgi:hypothetical protein
MMICKIGKGGTIAIYAPFTGTSKNGYRLLVSLLPGRGRCPPRYGNNDVNLHFLPEAKRCEPPLSPDKTMDTWTSITRTQLVAQKHAAAQQVHNFKTKPLL